MSINWTRGTGPPVHLSKSKPSPQVQLTRTRHTTYTQSLHLTQLISNRFFQIFNINTCHWALSYISMGNIANRDPLV